MKNNVFSQSLTDFGVEIEIWNDGDHQFTVSIYIIDSNIITDQGSILHFVKEECWSEKIIVYQLYFLVKYFENKELSKNSFGNESSH